MQYRRLGSTGLPLSLLSYGSWVTFGNQLDDSLARELMTTAYDAGVNFFDNAEAYAQGESERIMGRVLAAAGWPRDSYVLSSKAMFGRVKDPLPTQRGLHRKHLVDACHQALQRLQTDYLDLYFCHRPDPETPVAEVVRTMNQLIQQGKVLYWGTSEWPAAALCEAMAFANLQGLIPPAMEQPEYNLFQRDRVEKEYGPFYKSPGLGTTTWSPLASGLLTGKYNDGLPSGTRVHLKGYEWLRKQFETPETAALVPKVRRLQALAAELGVSLPQLAIAWCARNPNVSSVILGASKPEQLRENLRALDVLDRLTPEVMARIDTMLV